MCKWEFQDPARDRQRAPTSTARRSTEKHPATSPAIAPPDWPYRFLPPVCLPRSTRSCPINGSHCRASHRQTKQHSTREASHHTQHTKTAHTLRNALSKHNKQSCVPLPFLPSWPSWPPSWPSPTRKLSAKMGTRKLFKLSSKPRKLRLRPQRRLTRRLRPPRRLMRRLRPPRRLMRRLRPPHRLLRRLRPRRHAAIAPWLYARGLAGTNAPLTVLGVNRYFVALPSLLAFHV